jgi:excisionase family DNA binding protein
MALEEFLHDEQMRNLKFQLEKEELIREYQRKEKFYTTEEIADLLNVSTRVIRDIIKSNELIAIKIGREYRIRESDLEKFFKEHSTNSQSVIFEDENPEENLSDEK